MTPYSKNQIDAMVRFYRAFPGTNANHELREPRASEDAEAAETRRFFDRAWHENLRASHTDTDTDELAAARTAESYLRSIHVARVTDTGKDSK